MSLALLTLRQVSKNFPHCPHPALDQVSLELQQGDLLGVLGPSGCGKTTLLRLIAGFEQPDQGTLELNGRQVASPQFSLPPEQRGIGLVFQDYALFPHLTVLENILFGLRPFRNHSKAAATVRAREVLNLVGLEIFKDRYPHQLSGGQQQRVALARALAPQPQLILLDEPLSNLDVQVRHYLRDEIRNILKDTDTTAIFVTHDQEEALAISDYVAVMQRGRIEQLASPELIYREPASRFVAEFVTQANFLSARRQGTVWETELGSFPLQEIKQDGERVHLMIRQEDLLMQPDPQGEVQIRACQFLGREYRYCLLAESGREYHVRSQDKLPVGSRVRLKVAEQGYRIFA
ncbi:MAG: ABC transporter ATP-binding protein [Synechococcaceae cyanobacterium SM2_3_1]|nr:ABC transporter ATP-binding protein [Synechococcaceae cyanobacterium SM2_3_1]